MVLEEAISVQIDPTLLNTIMVGIFTLFGASFGGLITYLISRQRMKYEEEQRLKEERTGKFEDLAENILNPIFYELRSNSPKLRKAANFLTEFITYNPENPMPLDLASRQKQMTPELTEWNLINKHKRRYFFDRLWNDLSAVYGGFEAYDSIVEVLFLQFVRFKNEFDKTDSPEFTPEQRKENISRLKRFYQEQISMIYGAITTIAPRLLLWSDEIIRRIESLLKFLSIDSAELERLSLGSLDRQYEQVSKDFSEGFFGLAGLFDLRFRYIGMSQTIELFRSQEENLASKLSDPKIKEFEKDELKDNLKKIKDGREELEKQIVELEEQIAVQSKNFEGDYRNRE
ncbi:MAG: hypothetical protein ACFFBS_01175 [Promethearchaeota archaeon]